MKPGLCVAVTVSAALAGFHVAAVPRASSPEALATLILQPVHGTAISAWRTTAPAATWQRYRGTYEEIIQLSQQSPPLGVERGGFWCAVATDRSGNIERVVVFFALRDTRPAACR